MTSPGPSTRVTCIVHHVIDPARIDAFEQCRQRFTTDPDFLAADRIRDDSGCVVRHDRTFMRPLFPDDGDCQP